MIERILKSFVEGEAEAEYVATLRRERPISEAGKRLAQRWYRRVMRRLVTDATAPKAVGILTGLARLMRGDRAVEGAIHELRRQGYEVLVWADGNLSISGWA